MAKNNKKQKSGGGLSLTARIVWRIVLYALVITVIVIAGQKAYSFGYSVFTSRAMSSAPGKDVAVTIGENMSDRAVGELLESKGLIRDSTVFAVQAKVYDYEILPGTYILNTSQTVQEMIDIMSQEPETEEDGTVIPTKGGAENESSPESTEEE